ncbi:hypothetical protein J8L88_07130 [Aquimarina sp. MMG015]|uniref:hypothetical protein n=1 Tax=Aquimarina sp. MMG015 TaxID=2822689 RepID=UPI001B3A39AA|nr:hypothetical protein [Aquimarina sp. MMG015]MBQ4802627.1 hypothetical protein [Aquimarina sp. MMG015]
MKTLKFLLLAVLLGLNFVSCDPPSINEEVGVEQVEKTSFTEDGEEEDVKPGDL